MLSIHPSGQRLARFHLFYGQHLAARGIFLQAETELLEAVSQVGDVRRRTLVTHPDDVILGFVSLYEAWGKPEKVVEFRKLRAELMNSGTGTSFD